MVADLTASAYLVDGADLAASGVTLNNDGAGIWDGFTEDLSTDTYPGTDGGLVTGGSFRPYLLTNSYTVRGSSPEDAWAKVRTLRRACKPGRGVTLTRRMPDPEGGASNTDLTAPARRIGDRPTWLAKRGWVLDIDWWVTDVWHGPSVTIASASGTQSILGDTRTRRMTVTLPAGAARTVSNTTNGYWFTFGTTVPAGGILVDVEKRTAIAITGGADFSTYLSWGKAAPFQLESGSNALTVSTGSASISYQPAYL